jgi:2-oxoglutarate ferredoxin oxidoreductase subunit beta
MVIGGDGDIGDIGGNHLIHAARRDIDLTVILANNGLYGMTGGQAACTTPLSSRTATSRKGNPYRPFDFPKLVKAAGAPYVARQSVTQPISLLNGIKTALQTKGFSFIEVLSPCPTQFGRRNEMSDPAVMFKSLMERCILKQDVKGLEANELRDKIILGEISEYQTN